MTLRREQVKRDDLQWYGPTAGVDFSTESRSLAYCLRGAGLEDNDLYLMMRSGIGPRSYSRSSAYLIGSHHEVASFMLGGILSAGISNGSRFDGAAGGPLPGAMFRAAWFDDLPLMGAPACGCITPRPSAIGFCRGFWPARGSARKSAPFSATAANARPMSDACFRKGRSARVPIPRRKVAARWDRTSTIVKRNGGYSYEAVMDVCLDDGLADS
jgi:hypothetical protein